MPSTHYAGRSRLVEEFSRCADSDNNLRRHLLRRLVTVSHGERFLRAGFPKAETLLLFRIKIHDFRGNPTCAAANIPSSTKRGTN